MQASHPAPVARALWFVLWAVVAMLTLIGCQPVAEIPPSGMTRVEQPEFVPAVVVDAEPGGNSSDNLDNMIRTSTVSGAESKKLGERGEAVIQIVPPTEENGKNEDLANDEDVQVVASHSQPDLPIDAAWKPLTDSGLIWIDPKTNSVIATGKVCMREGPLEMFACPPNTKEYESVVMVDCPAFMIHGALLAVGAEPGSPVRFNPYRGASGPIVDVFVEWLEEDGTKRRERAQEWIRHAKTGEPMEFDFVFGGSGFWTDEETGDQKYFAEGGELICVSNFSTATMDLPVESSQDNQGLLFTAFTDKIPKRETKIHLILVPRPKVK